jgi:hypothetical protein
MRYFSYDPKTGVLCGSSIADANPMRKGEWLMPAFSTTKTPPATPKGKVPVFHDDAWHVIDERLLELPVEADEQVGVETVRAKKREFINAVRDNTIYGGFFFQGHRFDSDRDSIAHITAAAAAAGFVIPEGFTWRDAENNDVPMGSGELTGLVSALQKHIWRAHALARRRKELLEKATTIEEIDAVDVVNDVV